MPLPITRRAFLAGSAAAAASAQPRPSPAFPLVDYHVHLDRVVTLEKALEISKQKGVKFGIVEHAGTKEFPYPGMLNNDEDMKRFLEKLAGKPVFTGIQAEGLNWPTAFSKEMIARLDYVLTDALTFIERDGRQVRLWNRGVRFDDPQDFMGRYVDYHVQIMAREPIDILANLTFLPASLEKDFDALWTAPRMKKVIDAAVSYGVAFEINSNYRLPRMPFLKLARRAGIKFCFGSNIHGPDVGNVDYGLEAAKELSLGRKDIFTPAPRGRKPVERRKFS